jgi:hypothetical protein
MPDAATGMAPRSWRGGAMRRRGPARAFVAETVDGEEVEDEELSQPKESGDASFARSPVGAGVAGVPPLQLAAALGPPRRAENNQVGR